MIEKYHAIEIDAEDQPASSALAKVDNLKPEFVFIPGNIDGLLMEIREQALAEVKGLNISTPKQRDAIKKTANKVVKSRTFIERLRVGYVSAEKKRLATVDEEARRIKDILQGIEDEVRKPLTEWENADKARSSALEKTVDEVNAMQPHLYADIPALEAAISKLETLDPESMQEWKVSAQVAKDKTMVVLLDALKQRQQAEANAKELERLRSELAAMDEAEARATDKAHRGRINKEAIDGLVNHMPMEWDVANAIVSAIAANLIPHITVNY